jgi:hypothetical protein
LKNMSSVKSHFKIVHSFAELMQTPFELGLNALCWQRRLEGDFAAVAAAVPAGEDIVNLNEELLAALPLSPAAQRAAQAMWADYRLLQEYGLAPELNAIFQYPTDDSPGPLPIDVFSWHADSATVPADTFLCSYAGATSQGLANEDAIPLAHDPPVRQAWLELYGGPDDAGFAEFLTENFYDLHYKALPGAQPFDFGLGNLWRIATDYAGNPVLPCIHRAPRTSPGASPRLLLIS